VLHVAFDASNDVAIEPPGRMQMCTVEPPPPSYHQLRTEVTDDVERVFPCAAGGGVVAVMGAAAIVAGVALTLNTLALLLAAFFVPPAVMLLLWRVPSAVVAAISSRG
jgi:hypothetical protein